MELNDRNDKIWEFINNLEQDHPAQLVLKQKQYPDLPLKELASQIASRQKAKTKLPEWYAEKVWFPPKLSLEQCSSEATAKFKSSLISGESFADLTGGFGIDTYYLSQKFSQNHYIEQQVELCELAKYNFGVLNSKIDIHHSQSETFLENIQKPLDWIYLDPARRGDENQKVFLWEDCSPNLVELLHLLFEKAQNIMVKAAPMQDVSRAITELDNKVKAVYIIEWQGEVKELLYILSKEAVEYPEIHAVQLSDDGNPSFIFAGNKLKETESFIDFKLPQQYLYEPSPAMMKAGFFKQMAQKFQLSKLHSNTNLFTSNEIKEEFPGRRFKIIYQIPVQKKELKKHLPEMKANLASRNFPMPIAQLKKKLGLKDGGDKYLFATTLRGEEKTLLFCKKMK
ncbi:THUMP-like domain-containing protein [Marivirga sp.]|uniref:THUMP-like domain-containing protein n=1 Tax=Marivirga sp. TaxID=2018662 RepID=UPI002D80D010|nr:SAM-dependent methyltransferase [Marivirga sp.]HET8860608.1 SAM-dependent methyltransferase [Marivirga sp.]